MYIYTPTITITIANPETGSSSWARVWTPEENPYSGRREWACRSLTADATILPSAGTLLEAGTACKTYQGKVVDCHRAEGGSIVITIEPANRTHLPEQVGPLGPLLDWSHELSWNLSSHMAPLCSGAYNSICADGDVKSDAIPPDAVVLSRLCPAGTGLGAVPNYMTWGQYVALRAAGEYRMLTAAEASSNDRGGESGYHSRLTKKGVNPYI